MNIFLFTAFIKWLRMVAANKSHGYQEVEAVICGHVALPKGFHIRKLRCASSSLHSRNQCHPNLRWFHNRVQNGIRLQACKRDPEASRSLLSNFAQMNANELFCSQSTRASDSFDCMRLIESPQFQIRTQAATKHAMAPPIYFNTPELSALKVRPRCTV